MVMIIFSPVLTKPDFSNISQYIRSIKLYHMSMMQKTSVIYVTIHEDIGRYYAATNSLEASENTLLEQDVPIYTYDTNIYIRAKKELCWLI